MSDTQEQARVHTQTPGSLEKIQERKQDARRKILIGSYCIHKANREGTLVDLYQEMDNYIKRNADRALFKLEPVGEKH